MRFSTAGFIFNKRLDKVLLVHKLAPHWQAGKLNGIGGKVEIGESSLDCIVREIKEETGIETEKQNWKFVGSNHGTTWHADFYGYVYEGPTFTARVFEKEKIEWFPVSSLPKNIMPNLAWLIPMAKDKVSVGEFTTFTVNYP